jgi:hypothetical protein
MSDIWSHTAPKPRPKALVKAAYQLLMADKAMVGVLAVGAIASFVAMGAILAPAWLMGLVHPGSQGDGPVGYAVYAAALWASSFVTVLTSGAIVAAAMMRADGQDPTVGQALAAAWARRGPLAAWATVSTIVGLISRALSRFGVEGLIVRALAGLAWVVATTFAVPVIMAEGTMPVATVRRSSSIVMHTFGRTIRSQFRLGVLWAVAIVAGMVVTAYGAVAVGLGINDADPIEVAAGLLVGGVGLVVFLFACITSSALNAYLSAVLYRYATGRPLPGIDPAYLPPLPKG